MKFRLGQHPVSNALVKGSFEQSQHFLELSSPPGRTTQNELPLDPLVGEEILELLISHYLLDPFGCTDESFPVIGIHLLGQSPPGNETLETYEELCSFQTG